MSKQAEIGRERVLVAYTGLVNWTWLATGGHGVPLQVVTLYRHPRDRGVCSWWTEVRKALDIEDYQTHLVYLTSSNTLSMLAIIAIFYAPVAH